MKATKQYFPVVLFTMLYKEVLNFESVDGILQCFVKFKLKHSCQWKGNTSGHFNPYKSVNYNPRCSS